MKQSSMTPNGSAMHMLEIQSLDRQLTAMRRAYDFGIDYKAAERRRLVLVNPAGNYEVARRSALARYLSIKNASTSPHYRRWVRQTALADLAQAKEAYRGIL